MAFIRQQFCYVCGFETTHTNGKCNTCVLSEQKEEYERYRGELNKLSLEERVKNIEDWIFNLPPSPIKYR